MLGLPARFRAFCRDTIRKLCEHQPVVATLAGVHAHDGRLDDLSAAGISAQLAFVRRAQRELGLIFGELPWALELDRRLLADRLAGLALLLDEVQPWVWNPDYWNETAGEGISSLVARSSVEPSERIATCAERLRQVPALFALARSRLEDPPRPLVRVAEEQARSSIRFYEKVVPRAFPSVRARAARRGLEEAAAAAGSAALGFARFLAGLGRSAGGQLGVGEDVLARKLALDERLVESPSDLARRAREELWRLRGRCEELALEIVGPRRRGRGAAQVLAELSSSRPEARQVLPEVRATVRGLARFCREAELVTLPEAARCTVEPMPSYLTAMTVAAMDVPGPFDPDPKGARYLVTLPEPTWNDADRETALRAFNRAQIHWLTAHEAFPGHLVQLGALRRCPSPVRRFFCPDTLVEGWAHYAEGLVFEAGYRRGDPSLLLSKEHGALMRAARCVACLELHARQMTLEQASAYLRDEGLFSPRLARSEALRCAVDFSCVGYTLGRLGLEALREEVHKAWRPRYTPRRFHDAVMAEGQLPIALLREALLRGAATSAGMEGSSGPAAEW